MGWHDRMLIVFEDQDGTWDIPGAPNSLLDTCSMAVRLSQKPGVHWAKVTQGGDVMAEYFGESA